MSTILITGAATGIGRLSAIALARVGHTVYATMREPEGRNAARAESLRTETAGHDLRVIELDVQSQDSANQAVQTVLDEAGGLDVVVHNAAHLLVGYTEAFTAEDVAHLFDVNVLGAQRVNRAALPHLRERRGRIVTVASTLGRRALPAATAYCASKFGVVGFTRALAAETAGEVGVTLLMPGGMATSFFDGREERFKPPPDAMLNPPEEVAEAVLFALRRPPGVEVRELLVCPSREPSWP